MRVALTISCLTIMAILPASMIAQNSWIDSVKHTLQSAVKDTNRVWSLITLCDAYAYTEPDTAFRYGAEAYELSEKLDNDKGRLYSIISINSALFTMGNYTLELDFAFKLLPLSKRMNDINATGFSFGTVGDTYINLQEYAMALPYYRQVLQIGITANLPELHRMYSGMVPLYIGLKEYDSALWYAQKGYTLFKTSPYYTPRDWNTLWSETGSFLSLGQAWGAKKQYDTSLFYYRKSVAASEANNSRFHQMTAWLGMANIFNQQYQFDSAILYAQKILLEKNRSIYPSGKQKAAELLATVYQYQRQSDSALKYLRLSIQLKDSLYNHEKMMAFQNIRFKETEKEHAVREATNALQNRYQLYFLFGGLLIAVIIIAIVLKSRRQKQLQTIRNSIAHDLHDEVGSALSSINIMSELAKAKSPDAAPLLDSIGENTTAIQENMSDIVWAVNPKNDHFESMVNRMSIFATEILEAKAIHLSFVSDHSLLKVQLTMQQRKNFYLFFKEAINNAAKHSGAGNINVSLVRKENSIELSISDDGKGFEKNASYNGNGLHSLQKRATELKANYTIESTIEGGTSITLKFKAS